MKAVDHPATKTAGLGYGILRALGAHERLSPRALDVIAAWSAEYGAANGRITPDPMNLRGQDFADRVGTTWGAHRASENANRYAGTARRPSYAEVYEAVWVRQEWPDLCRALAGRVESGI